MQLSTCLGRELCPTAGRASPQGDAHPCWLGKPSPPQGTMGRDGWQLLTPNASAKAVAPSFSRRFLPATKAFRASGLPWALDFR